ncbi:MAG: diaminopimelate decarboxylase [Bacilli bacterium]|nr:diaminopimelate decarboxylase [Bacilli bacterium]
MVLQSEFITIKDNSLFIDGVNASTLAKQYGTPLYVMSESHIRKQLNTLKENFMDKYDNTLPLFASKSFSCLEIYRIANEYGIGIDCVSAGEISIALKAGFNPEKIYFHGNNKLPSEIEYALKNKVSHFVIDNFYEIELVEEIARELNTKVYATIRVTPGVYAGGHDYIRVGAKDTKFGFSSHDNTYLKAIGLVLDSEYIEFEGIHCHVGSQIEEIQAYVLAMQKFVEIAYQIYETYGVVIKKLNAGGGFGIQYTKADQPLNFDLVVKTIVDIVNTGFEARGWERPMIMIEPGRYVVGNAGITLYTVGSIKDIPNIRKYISVDGGMNENIRPALYQAKYDALIANKAEEEKDTLVTVAGKNCESGDILIKDIMMANPQSKDLLAIFSTGAYHYSMSSNYNQIPKPAVVFVKDGESRIVIRRQTFDDLVNYDV